jgi:hypothetical protein
MGRKLGAGGKNGGSHLKHKGKGRGRKVLKIE